MKFFLVTLFISIFIFTPLEAQNNENYFIKTDGSKIMIYNNKEGKTYRRYDHVFDTDYALNGVWLWYHNKKGKLNKISQHKIKEAFLDGKYFILLKGINMFGTKRLHEVIVQNDEYMLTQYYFQGVNKCYLIDKKKDKFIFKKKVISLKRKKDKRLFEKKIKPYFKNCQEFIELTYKSLESEYYVGFSYPSNNNMFRYVTNLSCN